MERDPSATMQHDVVDIIEAGLWRMLVELVLERLRKKEIHDK